MTHPIQIIGLRRTSRDVDRFLRVPYPIYGDDPNWVAPLTADLKKVFLDTNPLFEHAEMRLWVATRDGKDVGRIAGILDRNHIAKHADGAAFWGFFESVDDGAVAAALFDKVSAWAKEKGCGKILGPMNPTTNDECGLLVDGFDRPPVVMMTYNPRYYVPLVEACGFTKAKDLLAYHYDITPEPLERLEKISRGVARRNPDVRIVPIRKKHLAADLAKVKAVYNAAWEDNWGFVPMTDAELDFMGVRLKPLLVEDYALIVEDKGVPVAFMLSLPDYNEPIKPMRGRMLTPKIWGLVRTMMGKRVPRLARVVTLGIVPGHRQRGIDAMLLAHSLRKALDRGVKEFEVSWMLEDNVMILRPIEVFGGTRYKTYRLY
ncbi:MAG: hypothetical protein JWO31_3466, partial [Phycisphaerales bacterium]|nr:hypothetical protein [Phycisphaerales bacterium]